MATQINVLFVNDNNQRALEYWSMPLRRNKERCCQKNVGNPTKRFQQLDVSWWIYGNYSQSFLINTGYTIAAMVEELFQSLLSTKKSGKNITLPTATSKYCLNIRKSSSEMEHTHETIREREERERERVRDATKKSL